MTSYEHKVKNIYLGEPLKYTPTEYTIAYYPLNQNTQLTDKSGHGYDLINSGGTLTYDEIGVTAIGVSGARREATGITQMMGVTTQGTANIRVKTINKGDTQYINMGDYHTNNSGILIREDDTGKTKLGNQGAGSSGYITLSNNIRYNLVATYTTGSMKLYVNGNTTPSITRSVTLGNSANGKLSLLNMNSGTTMLSEAIFESKARTEQEISDYYNQTKSNYGL